MQRLPVPEWIRRKRDGRSLDDVEIGALVRGYAAGSVPDYQMAAFAMAVYFRGLSPSETSSLTRAMRDSGEVVPRGTYGGAAIDKHSTGGVGDKVSIALAPLVAACGVRVPMICGRGLGHTGGTVDKMESIRGYRARLSRDELVSIVRTVGAVVAGQSESLAPADKKLYALRDVTATVESIPLITASILSKKLAEGLDGLVMDVKCGRGAFMKTESEARALAQSLVDVGGAAGVPVVSVLTRMDAPLGRTIGNALEVVEAIELLRGDADPELLEVTLALGAEMLALAGIDDARSRLLAAIAHGEGLAKLAAMIEAQGGDPRVVEDPSTHLPRAPSIDTVIASASGVVRAIDSYALGTLAVSLGAGRTTADQAIDPSVGLEILVREGDEIHVGDPLARVHAASRADVEGVAAGVRDSFELGERRESGSRILDVIRGGALRIAHESA